MKRYVVFLMVIVGLFLTVVPANAAVIYSNDFEGSVGTEWSNTTTETTPGTVSHLADGFLGQFYADDSVVLTLNNLPPHTELTVSFDLYIIKTWDGISSGYVQPDVWDLSILKGKTLLHTTFANYVGIRHQSYPDAYPGGDYESRTGAAENDTLGFTYHDIVRDSVYSFDGVKSFTFSHSGDSVSLVFSSDIRDINPGEESWGLDNVVVVSEPAEVEMEWVTVGNAGNANDDTGYGGVSDVYQIGKYEVTAGQYTEFLNAVATTDTYGLYDTQMWSHLQGCKIQRNGNSGNYTYSVAADYANKPVNFVNFGDSARFINWLHNGQPTGAQGLSTTEDGSYYLNGATTTADLMAITRQADATWFLPTEDEWYKAAYHKNDGVTGNYWDYPISSDSISTAMANYGISVGHTTEVGSYAYNSPYGISDMGGNVWEWNEGIVSNSLRNVRAGSFNSDDYAIVSSFRWHDDPYYGDSGLGFRVASVAEPACSGKIIAWGYNGWGQCNPPVGNDFVAILSGGHQCLALKNDGSLAAWGDNTYGQTDDMPSSNDFIAVASGLSHNLALRANGSLVAWGRNQKGQCNVPAGNGFTAIAAGDWFNIALKTDGSLAGWGRNDFGECDVPIGNNFTAIAAGGDFGMAIRNDGSLAAWGYNNRGQCNVPTGNDFVSIAGGTYHGLALRADGSLIAWGYNYYGQLNIPSGDNFVAIAAGAMQSLALKADGSLIAWGDNTYGQSSVPAGHDFVAISTGGYSTTGHGLALTCEEPAEPNIAVFPLSHDFGDVESGTSSTVVVTISNVGNGDLTVSGIALETDFAITSVPPASVVVGPSETVDVEVTYTPTVLGYNSAVLKIISDDPDEPVVEVTLGAVGIEIPLPPSQQIANILAFFDESVVQGSLVGDGPGNSAGKRLNALRNMIEAAGDLIEDDLFEEACQQLLDVYRRMDGQPKPPDFVKGEAVAGLASMITELRESLGCE